MKRFTLLCALIALAGWATPTSAQSYDLPQINFSRRSLDGPRLGATYVLGQSTLTKELRDRRIGSLISQFGWHFEYQVVPDGEGPSFVIEGIPLVGGVEYGTLIPSGTLAMGIRFPSGWEFGMGPNTVFTDQGVKTALVLAVGKSINYGGVSIPLNLVLATNPDGNRLSFMFGYAIFKPEK
ncbi:MAG TPA: hypothetical protein DCX46_02420 [Bacteroidetes bacterium]|nr:MAG: hypothetical protein A2X68_02720 [Ignavibacteria bacterium GWC2_56_12]HAV22349.1 hypothetical protein [Bacteroidota bacterium]